MKKPLCTLLAGLVVLFTTPVLAQSTTSITDLMGERPSNSYYQDSSLQAQGSSITNDSGTSDILKQEVSGNLKVDTSTVPAEYLQSADKSTQWWPAVLVSLFILSAFWLVALSAIAKRQAQERNKKSLAKPVRAKKSQPKKRTKKNPKK